ncbi:MAG: AMP-binding protein [Planctomycetota bacterium]
MNVAEQLLRQARQRDAAIAIVQPTSDQDRTITFAELDAESAALAERFQSQRLAPGSKVLVMLGVSIDLYVALTAIFRAGLVAVFLDPSAGREHVRRCGRMCPPDALLGPWKAQALRLLHPSLRRARSLVFPRRRTTRSSRALNEMHELHPDAPALITFTSGSTGQPKGVVRSHGLLLAQREALSRAIDLRPGQVDLATLPVFVLANLAAGVTTVIADADLRRPGFVDAGPVLRQIDRHGVTRSTASPAFFGRLAERCEREHRDLTSLRWVYTGGAPVHLDLLERLDRLMPEGEPTVVYGSTEAEPIAHAAWSTLSDQDRTAVSGGRGLLVGEPVSEVSVQIVNSALLSESAMSDDTWQTSALPTGQAGEIVVAGEHVVPGYLDSTQDAETKLNVSGRVWHRTGDAGYLDERGRLWLLGRVSSVLTDGGRAVFPFAVEARARAVPGVAQAALAAHGDRRVLAVEAKPEADPPALKAALLDMLSDDVDRVVLLPGLPMDTRHNAKVRYPALRDMIATQLDSGDR